MEDDFSPRTWFRNWPNEEIPRWSRGVYVIWDGDELIYCGMSGKQLEEKIRAIEEGRAKDRPLGLRNRLAAHASGRLSGDQFCVYVANRIVIPSITDADKIEFAAGTLRLDHVTKQWINDRYEYQYLLVDSDAATYELENRLKAGHYFGGKPLLNPE